MKTMPGKPCCSNPITTPLLGMAISLLMVSPAFAQAENEILSVSPASAAQADTSVFVSFTLDSDIPPPPPAAILPDSVVLGSISGTSIAHPSQYEVTALFDIPVSEALGAKDALVSFTGPSGTISFMRSEAFTVTAGAESPPAITSQPQSQTAGIGATAVFNVTADGAAPLFYQWQRNTLDLAAGTNSIYFISSAATNDAGSYRCVVTNAYGAATSSIALLTVRTDEITTAADVASDEAYDAGWTNGANGGTGFNSWDLTPNAGGGFFTGSSAGNAGGNSGSIDYGGRSWGLWSTNGVTEAVRSWSGGALAIGQIFGVELDNGYIDIGRSIGLALQNTAGEALWEFYFTGGDSHYTVHDAYGGKPSPVPFTGDGFLLEVELTTATSCLVKVTAAADAVYFFKGDLIPRTDQGIARARFWNYEAGTDSNSDFYLNHLTLRTGSLEPMTPALAYPVVDSDQDVCFNTTVGITAPAPGSAFAGQDAQYDGHLLSYTLSADGLTVTDNNTGLIWTRSPDLDMNGILDIDDKLTQAEAVTYAATLNAQSFGGYDDWRLPSIKELYSLMNFKGQDISGDETPDVPPFIDNDYFDFGYGDTNAGERLIDAQWATTTLYIDTVMDGQTAMFGLNLADGRIKGYPTSKDFYVYYVRGPTNIGVNAFTDNGDGTVTDHATGLMWQQTDSLVGMNWESALAYAEGLNLAGCQDWRLPNAKELQSIVEYTRAPGITASAAIDPVFFCTAITNEAGQADFPWYWSSTTHAKSGGSPGTHGAYVCFGRALGYMNGSWMDVHGAGCQRSDPKDGSLTDWTYVAYGYYNANAPQGDAVRIFNHVRCVRGGATAPTLDTDGDGLTDWYEYNYVTNTTDMSPTGDLDGDGYLNGDEDGAGTSPVDSGSLLDLEEISWTGTTNRVIRWQSVLGKTYRIQRSTNLLTDAFATSVAAGITATPPMNVYTDTTVRAEFSCYRIVVE